MCASSPCACGVCLSLDNGEPDERSLHEGVAPTKGVKYAINGWVRSKNLFGSSGFA